MLTWWLWTGWQLASVSCFQRYVSDTSGCVWGAGRGETALRVGEKGGTVRGGEKGEIWGEWGESLGRESMHRDCPPLLACAETINPPNPTTLHVHVTDAAPHVTGVLCRLEVCCLGTTLVQALVCWCHSPAPH